MMEMLTENTKESNDEKSVQIGKVTNQRGDMYEYRWKTK
jgi:hypothetical protein